MNHPTALIKPLHGLRYVRVTGDDGYSMLVPVDENRFGGVHHAEATARRLLAQRRQGGVSNRSDDAGSPRSLAAKKTPDSRDGRS